MTPSRDVITSPQLSTLNLTYTNINTVSVATGSADDTFNVTPSTTILYTIDGGDQVQGDRLNLVPGPYTVQDDGSTAQIDGYQDIQYSNIEYKNFVATALAIGDPGYEQVAVGPGNFQYRPAGSPWTFAGGAGISGNNSGFTAGNPPAPEGAQVAFLQETGSFSQVVTGWAAGSYTLTFSAAQRANSQASRQDFRVLVDGVVVGTFTPSGTSYQSYTTAAFTVAAGSHTITFQGLDTAGGDNTAFIDAVARVSMPVVADAGFEQVAVGAGQLPVPPRRLALDLLRRRRRLGQQQRLHRRQPARAPGAQVAFLQGTGSFSQVVTGWAAGSYTLTF